MDAAVALLPAGAAIIVDFVGHPEAVARRMRELAPGRTVIDVGGAALTALEALLRSRGGYSRGTGGRAVAVTPSRAVRLPTTALWHRRRRHQLP